MSRGKSRRRFKSEENGLILSEFSVEKKALSGLRRSSPLRRGAFSCLSILILTAVLVLLTGLAGCGPSDQPGSNRHCGGALSPSDVLGDRSSWRNTHAGPANTDEVEEVLPSALKRGWVAETDMLIISAVTFDGEGNLYFSPIRPREEVVLVSLEPEMGQRRWAIPGIGYGAGSPMLLNDPDRPGEQLVYLGLYDEAMAVETDGTVLWRVPTGLNAPAEDPFALSFGLNYHPGADALVAITRDGFLYALDRRTGAPLLQTPFQLPGEKSATPDVWYMKILLPLIAWPYGEQFRRFLGIEPSLDFFRNVLEINAGWNSKVANFLLHRPQ